MSYPRHKSRTELAEGNYSVGYIVNFPLSVIICTLNIFSQILICFKNFIIAEFDSRKSLLISYPFTLSTINYDVIFN